MTNLLSNAVKFTSEGEIAVRVYDLEQDERSTLVRIEVADTGIGIEPDRIPMLFEPFAQADSSTTREYGGTGLGLAISHQLVELMGGSLEAESEPGHGTTFRVTLRLCAAAAGRTRRAARAVLP